MKLSSPTATRKPSDLVPFSSALSRRPASPATRLAPSDFAALVHAQRRTSLGAPKASAIKATSLSAAADTAPQEAEHDRLTQQARKWVGQTFFGTILKQMHDSPFKSELFEGGRGGQAFSPLYDQKLIEHMSRGAGNKLVNAIVRKIEARQAYAKQQGAPSPSVGRVAPAGEAGSTQTDAGSSSSAGLAARQSQPRSSGGESNPYQHVRVHVAPGLGA